MSKNRLILTNEDLRDIFNFRNYLNIPNKQYYCTIYGRTYNDEDGNTLFNTKEDCIESFMTSSEFESLWEELTDIVTAKYGYLLVENNSKNTGMQNKEWFKDDAYLKNHNKIEDCINYYKEVLINRMIRKRVIIFHTSR